LSIEALMALFIERGISGVPVVDAEGLPVGVVSKTDLVREQYENGESFAAEPARVQDLGDGFHVEPTARGTVLDIMTPLAFTLHERSSLSRAAAMMALEGVHRVPVISDDRRVVGILSSLDVMRWLAQHDGYLVGEYPRERFG
jgi:CBS domain-containing protein